MSFRRKARKDYVPRPRVGNYSVFDSRAYALAERGRIWHCTKCGRNWAMRGMHPDCDGEAADMQLITPATATGMPAK